MANGRGGGKRMGKQWGAIPATELTFTTAGTQLGAALVSTTAQTVLRMIGEYIIGSTTAPTALDSCSITCGIGIVSTDAFNAGVTAMPDPSGELDFPWLYWMRHSFFMADTGLGYREGASTRHSFDIRSMRKMKPRENLVQIFEYSDITGTPPMTVTTAGARVLIGLH